MAIDLKTWVRSIEARIHGEASFDGFVKGIHTFAEDAVDVIEGLLDDGVDPEEAKVWIETILEDKNVAHNAFSSFRENEASFAECAQELVDDLLEKLDNAQVALAATQETLDSERRDRA